MLGLRLVDLTYKVVVVDNLMFKQTRWNHLCKSKKLEIINGAYVSLPAWPVDIVITLAFS